MVLTIFFMLDLCRLVLVWWQWWMKLAWKWEGFMCWINVLDNFLRSQLLLVCFLECYHNIASYQAQRTHQAMLQELHECLLFPTSNRSIGYIADRGIPPTGHPCGGFFRPRHIRYAQHEWICPGSGLKGLIAHSFRSVLRKSSRLNSSDYGAELRTRP